MKKIVAAALILLLISNFPLSAYCADDAVKKLSRGVSNMLTCPFEIVEQAKRVNTSDGPWAACTFGIIKGVFMMGIRGVVGAYETTTFFIPLPK